MFCPNCGAHNLDGARFCASCGADLKEAQVPSNTQAAVAGAAGGNGVGTGGNGGSTGGNGGGGRKRWLISVAIALVTLAALGVAAYFNWRLSHTRINPEVIAYHEEPSSDHAAPGVAYRAHEAEPGFTLLEASDTTLVVSDLGQIHEGSILAIGITEVTPQGTLRKVESIQSQDGSYVLTTRPAALTEAIDRCDVDFTISATPDGLISVEVEDNLPESSVIGNIIRPTTAHALEKEFLDKKISLWQVPQEGEEAPTVGPLELTTQGYFELKGRIAINWGSIEFEASARVFADAHAHADGVTLTSFEKSFTLPINLPPSFKTVQFAIAGVPVVITNSAEAELTANAALKAGEIKADATLDRRLGFIYKSGSGVHAIDEDKSEPPTLEHGPRLIFEGGTGVGLRYEMLLYDLGGFNLGAGINTDIRAELGILEAQDGNTGFTLGGIANRLGGEYHVLVYAPVDGHLVLKWPSFNFFDNDKRQTLADVELFNTGKSLELLRIDESYTAGKLLDAGESEQTLEPETPESQTPESPTAVSTEDTRALYQQTLNDIQSGRTSFDFNPGYNAAPSSYEYTLVDMNGDGLGELLVKVTFSGAGIGSMDEIYVFLQEGNTLTLLEDSLTAGVAGAGGFRGGVGTARDGYGLVVSTGSSGTGQFESARVVINGTRLVYQDHENWVLGASEPSLASDSITWHSLSDSTGLNALH